MPPFPSSPSGPAIGRRFFLGSAAAGALATLAVQPAAAQGGGSSPARSAVDDKGVWRWPDGREVALFGVNYNLASAAAFRFAKASGVPFEQIVERDFAHFRRLGFTALRLSFWGDWETTSASGALIDNEHLAVLDRIVERAGTDGLSCLLSPIVTYDASWPDAMQQPRDGIAHAFEKSVLGTDPRAIAAQVRYLRALLSRTNPRTGRRYADEPAIVAVEPINEPAHHPEDRAGSIRYIDALAGAVRDAGFTGPVFHNVTQDMRIAAAIRDARVDGATFAWYPTGLQTGREVAGNGLLLVDRYDQFGDDRLQRRAKLVYEFDAADSMASYFYPAMARTFRTGGAQFAAMFAYDSLPIAAANSEFNDHYLNLVYTPAKALSARIAALAMQELPRGKDWGRYPQSMRFGGFRVDDAADLAVFADETRFFHTNDTGAAPAAAARLEHLGGVGSSPVVGYDGAGAWFLDRIEPGVWRLEVYPDAAVVANPFAFRRPARAAVRIVARSRRMTIDLPDLGRAFEVSRADGGKTAQARDGAFAVLPGIYRLAATATARRVDPAFFAAPGETFAPILQHAPPASRTAGKPWHFTAEIVAPSAPDAVTLWLRGARGLAPIPLNAGPRFGYSATVPAAMLKPGFLDYYITIATGNERQVAPPVVDSWPGDWDFPKTGGFRVAVTAADAPLLLFDAARHGDAVIVPYGGYAASPAIGIAAGESGDAVLRIDGAALAKSHGGDLPAQRAWNGALDDEGRDLARFGSLRVEGRATRPGGGMAVILIERDGMAWGAPVALSPDGAPRSVPLAALRPVDAAMLPRDFPKGVNPAFLRRPPGRGGAGDGVRLAALQAVQVTVATRFLAAGEQPGTVEVRRIALTA